MGWKTQGYYQDPSDSDLSWKWQVDGNCDVPNPEIEKYHLQNIQLADWKNKIQILYGNSSSPFFKGYIISTHLDLAVSQLSKFEGLKVYKYKYGDHAATFLIHQLNFLPIENLIIFYQKGNWTNENWVDLIDEISWILPKDSSEKIIKRLKKTTPIIW